MWYNPKGNSKCYNFYLGCHCFHSMPKCQNHTRFIWSILLRTWWGRLESKLKVSTFCFVLSLLYHFQFTLSIHETAKWLTVKSKIFSSLIHIYYEIIHHIILVWIFWNFAEFSEWVFLYVSLFLVCCFHILINYAVHLFAKIILPLILT